MDLTKTFGPAWIGSGTRGFFGEGYRIHRYLPGLSFEGSTFVAKTTTFDSNRGNMPLDRNYEPVALFPDCVWMDLIRAVGINSVGLSGPGALALLKAGKWQEIKQPFFISFMPLATDEVKHVQEVLGFTRALQIHLPDFTSQQLGLQLNISCPNVGADLTAILEKAHFLLDSLGMLGIPILVKLNLLVAPEAAVVIAAHPACSGLVISNTLPFGERASEVPWDLYFPNGSPLPKAYGKGGLSGRLLFTLVYDWVVAFRRLDSATYLNVGGGIVHPDDVSAAAYAGADSISFASVAVMRPWRVPHIIERAYQVFA